MLVNTACEICLSSESFSGFKIHDETHKSITVGLEGSLETVLGSESTFKQEITNAVTQGTTENWNHRTRLTWPGEEKAGKMPFFLKRLTLFYVIL